MWSESLQGFSHNYLTSDSLTVNNELFISGVGRQVLYSKRWPGIYGVSLRYTDDCGYVYNVSRDILFEQSLNSFSIYPNPATAYVTISLDGYEGNGQQYFTASNTPGEYQIQLWDSYGLVKQVTTGLPEYRLDLTGILPGFYYVHIIKDGIKHRRQLLVN